MSRIGKQPIPIPKGVAVTVNGTDVTVKGPKGELKQSFNRDIGIKQEGNEIVVTRPSDQRQHRALHGLTRALLNNMIVGVSDGFTRVLEIQGVGYRAEVSGKDLILHVGYSHPVQIPPPDDTLTFEVPKESRGTKIIVSGVDKQVVGEIAAFIRKQRPPEPYKGKGIRYEGEYVRSKAGKSGKTK